MDQIGHEFVHLLRFKFVVDEDAARRCRCSAETSGHESSVIGGGVSVLSISTGASSQSHQLRSRSTTPRRKDARGGRKQNCDSFDDIARPIIPRSVERSLFISSGCRPRNKNSTRNAVSHPVVVAVQEPFSGL